MTETYQIFQHSEQMNELAEALALAQGQMSNPTFDSVNPHFKHKYASLAVVRDAVIPPLAAQGIATVQMPVTDIEHDKAGCTTMLMHKSGQYLTHTLLLPISKADVQGYCSAISYAQRYSLKAVAGVAGEEDDDGEGAVTHEKEHQGYQSEHRDSHKRASVTTTANGTSPVATETPKTDTSTSIWRDTLRVQSAVLTANWDLSGKEQKVLAGLNTAIHAAQGDAYYPDSKGLALADAALQWVDKLEAMEDARDIINAGIPESN